MSKSARQSVFNALLRVERDCSYSNITLDKILSETELSERDKSFASMLFYGTIEKKILLDYNISQYSDKPVNKLDMEVLLILRMGMYQIYFMDSVPDSAAVNESAALCKENNLYSASGFVNAVLRNVSKSRILHYPNRRKGKNKYLSVKYSCPEEIISLWRKSYGDELTEGILQSLDGRPPISARVNTLKVSQCELIDSLNSCGISAKQSKIIDNCIELKNTGAIDNIKQFVDGLFHIQDTASQICCSVLDVKENQTVIDSCSAPGGKTFTLAEIMKNTGKVFSCDLYQSRLNLVNEGSKRLDIKNIITVPCNASEYQNFPKADRILCDVPCSGLGILRRKPELRYKKNLGLDTLPNLQYLILCNCSKFLKSGGIIVYSTCTLNPQENRENAERFLNEHKDFEPYPIKSENIKRGIDEPENQLTLFPHINDTDGFFISAFKRK